MSVHRGLIGYYQGFILRWHLGISKITAATIGTTVEPPRKGHFGTNINSSGLSPLWRLSSSKRFQSHYIDREG